MSSIGDCQPYTQSLMMRSQLAIADWQAPWDERLICHSAAILVSTLFSKAIVGLILPLTLVEMVGRVSLIPVALFLNAPSGYYSKVKASIYQPLHSIITLFSWPKKLNRVAIEIDALYQESLIFSTSYWPYVPLAPTREHMLAALKFMTDFHQRIFHWQARGNQISTWVDYVAAKDMVSHRYHLILMINKIALGALIGCATALTLFGISPFLKVLGGCTLIPLTLGALEFPSNHDYERRSTAIDVLAENRPAPPRYEATDKPEENLIHDVFENMIRETDEQIHAIDHPYMGVIRDGETVKDAIYLFENHQFTSLLVVWKMKELGVAILPLIEQLTGKPTIENEKIASHFEKLQKLTELQMDYLVQCLAEANYPVKPNLSGSEGIGILGKDFEDLYLFISGLGGNLLHNNLYQQLLVKVKPGTCVSSHPDM